MWCRQLAALALLVFAFGACTPFVREDDRSGGQPPAPDAGAPALPETGAFPDPTVGTARIAAFNVHRLFDTVCDSGRCASGDYEEQPSQAAFDAQAEEIAHAIRLLRADVVLVEEVETQRSLDALTRRLPGYAHAILGETGGAGSVDVGVISKHPITWIARHRDRQLTRPDGTITSFSREFLQVHLDLGGRTVIVFAAHFRSKVSDDPGRRLAEAQAAHDIVSAAARQYPEALLVLGGDLNDTPGSAPLEALESSGNLLRVAKELPPQQQGTYWYGGSAIAIDHLLLATHGAGSYAPASFRVARDEGARGWGGSDHCAIFADFALP